jgi:hypothetical protein
MGQKDPAEPTLAQQPLDPLAPGPLGRGFGFTDCPCPRFRQVVGCPQWADEEVTQLGTLRRGVLEIRSKGLGRATPQ